jgi:hypothetical protein
MTVKNPDTRQAGIGRFILDAAAQAGKPVWRGLQTSTIAQHLFGIFRLINVLHN